MIGTKILEERRSKYNGDIKVVKTLGMGTYIQANGLTQSGGVIEIIWKQTLRKIKNEKLKIKKCLILGLGGGTAAKFIRKYWPEARITGVEIDPAMIELGRKYLDLKDVQIKMQDAYNFDAGGYDLVVVDLYCGDKFPKKFENEKFLKKLTKNKLVVINRLYFGDKRKDAVKFGEKLRKIFDKVEYFYPEVNAVFILR